MSKQLVNNGRQRLNERETSRLNVGYISYFDHTQRSTNTRKEYVAQPKLSHTHSPVGIIMRLKSRHIEVAISDRISRDKTPPLYINGIY